MKHCLLASLLFILTTPALAGIYDITLRRVGAASDTEICAQIASELVAAFEIQTTANVIDYGCRRGEMSFDGIEVVLTYQAPARFAITSTYTMPIDSMAFYTSREDCQAQLNLQKELFEANTGLQSLVAYCMRDSDIYPKWLTRVDGLGTSAIQPDTASLNYSGDLLDLDTIQADFATAASAFGITIFEQGLVSDVLRKLVFRIYADDAYSIDAYDEMIFDNPTACQEAANTVRGFMTSADKPVVVLCAQVRNREQTTMHTATFKKTLERNLVFAARQLSGTFTNLGACQAASEAIDDSDEDIFGVICSGTGESFKMNLFYRP